jgi:tRNA-2-methylthio-N6-dimethylallyladenosine synthase
MNEYDSDYLTQTLLDAGLLPARDPEKADFILINSCAVRAKAEQKAYSLLGRMISLKRKKPHLIVGIAGCIAQQEGQDLFGKFPDLDLVLGTRELGSLQGILSRLGTERKKIVATCITLPPSVCIERPGYFEGRVKSYIPVMQGCDNFCTYCVVPYVRGREVSRSPHEILREAETLVGQGVKEITLLGQNVNSYRWNSGKYWGFTGLLEEMNRLEGLVRIRFTTSHPKDLSEGLIRCFGTLEKLCPHIHLPFQAGSNRILELMNRGYSREEYVSLIGRLRKVREDIAVTSDVMVGFPGESQEDFQLTLDLVEKIEFDSLFSFKYSDRKGTLARKMQDKVDESEKSTRLAVLQKLQRDITLKKNRGLEGKVLEVLVEGASKKGDQLTGRTSTNKIVNFYRNINILNVLVNVKIKQSFVNSLLGEIV